MLNREELLVEETLEKQLNYSDLLVSVVKY